jgi:hypothetical protein
MQHLTTEIPKMTRRTKRKIKRQLHRVQLDQLGWHRQWKNWRYKNTTYLLLSVIVFLYFATTPTVANVIESLGNTGYIGAFFAGIFIVSVFTAAPAAVVLFNLANNLHPLEIALLAGLGGMFGDYVIFRYAKDKVFVELAPLFRKVTTHRITKLYYTPYFMWLTPILGMIFIASPGPDEIGVGLLGLSKIKRWQFLLVTFGLNFGGILLVVLLARAT